MDGLRSVLTKPDSGIGIIMLTARDLEMDRIMGLNKADDYVVKPFNPLELVLEPKPSSWGVVPKRRKMIEHL